MKDVICFEVNDWHEYPEYFKEWFALGNEDKHPGEKWLPDLDAYAKENKLCIKVVVIDMAISLVVTAPKEWVEKNIPEFKEDKWRWECVFTYPWPFKNDCPFYPHSGFTLENTPEDHLNERKNYLRHFHDQFTEEEINNFKPHNITGLPSFETFLDWTEDNYGAKEWEDGKPYEEENDC